MITTRNTIEVIAFSRGRKRFQYVLYLRETTRKTLTTMASLALSLLAFFLGKQISTHMKTLKC